ncbi:indole-3-glycerol phosphate synthase TrpC [Deinococcus maricopensis]|uniref:indole-3-glycerol-phosphate synthase n=1 Tax=Deinococcus maricopensis (strain DSM 21211 / LMG 22137 / NRRL B-23946 / LB-34) TaxID=709986 RepID=E8U8K6_DEIML|nr:indole-3-glycerol phosphate synthase TrpC [Deinococcus maricopensis]ADV67395.1 Indole-3-glycerol-phosphate synthase [Deinococcus maricopensis DSM 21211]
MTFDRVPGVLGRIVRERAQDYADAPTDLGPARPRPRLFHAALAREGLHLIAEVKRASPSQGRIADLDPRAAALAYERGGAAAVSVLTEPRHFGGDAQALLDVTGALTIPALRKDFVVHPAMLREAAEWGARAVLLMVSVLGEAVGTYLEYAHHVGLDALVEVHDDAELDIALAAGAEIIGVNNRDLTTLHIDLRTAPRLIRRARDAGFTGLLVAESGYSAPADLEHVRGLADAVLVGSSLAASGNLERAARDLMTA